MDEGVSQLTKVVIVVAVAIALIAIVAGIVTKVKTKIDSEIDKVTSPTSYVEVVETDII